MSNTFETYPMETHAFEGGGNDFLCGQCRRPRALHYRYPFHPRPDPEHFFVKPYVRYRGAHPMFVPLGRTINEPVPTVTEAKRAEVERFREQERRSMARTTGGRL